MEYRELNGNTNTNLNSTQNRVEGESTSSFSMIELWERLKRNWYWLVIGLLLGLTAAHIHLRYSENTYRAEAKILLKEDATKGASELSVLTGKGMGRGDAQPNISDQIEIMRSRRIISKVVHQMDLNVRYFSDGRFLKGEIFPDNSPIKIRLLNQDYAGIRFEVKMNSASKIDIILEDKTISTSFGTPVKIGKTEFVVLPRDAKSINIGRSIMVSILPMESATSMYK